MNVFGLGNDLVRISRLKRLQNLHGNRFLGRFLSEEEQEIWRKRKGRHAEEYLAGRWAAKEAAYKALRGGRVPFPELVIKETVNGPELEFRGAALRQAEKNGVKGGLVAITHEDDLAMAHVILLRDPRAEFSSRDPRAEIPVVAPLRSDNS